MPKGNPRGKGLVDPKKNPRQGDSTKFKVETYHLEDKVISMKKAGCTIDEIQDAINTKYLTEEGQFISRMGISRFLAKELPDYKDYDQRYANININEYNELLDMLEYSEGQLEIAERTLADLRKQAKEQGSYASPKDITALMNASEKTLARRQSILADIIGCKEKIFSFCAMQQIIATLMNKVKAKDILLYAEIKNEFNADPMVAEMFKKIPGVAEKMA